MKPNKHFFLLIALLAAFVGLHLAWAAGTGREIALTRGKSINHNPRISPDGKRIVFVREFATRLAKEFVATDSNLWIMNDTGREQNQLTHFNVVKSLPSGARQPSWSPDGKRIGFRGVPSEQHGGIFVIDVDGTNLKQLTTNWLDGAPDYSPDGRHIAFTSQRRIWVMGSDGADAHPLTFGDLHQGVKFSRDGLRREIELPILIRLKIPTFRKFTLLALTVRIHDHWACIHIMWPGLKMANLSIFNMVRR